MRHRSIEAKLRHFTKYVLPLIRGGGVVFMFPRTRLLRPFAFLSRSSCRCSALMEGLVTPLQDRIEEWKKTANQLDKDHAKGEDVSSPFVGVK